ncbi:hypothetical protein [Streptomyces sp. NPDC051016]
MAIATARAPFSRSALGKYRFQREPAGRGGALDRSVRWVLPLLLGSA